MHKVKRSPFLSRRRVVVWGDAKSLRFQPVKKIGPHKLGCVLCVVPEPLRKQITDWVIENVGDEHLTEEGRELRPHVTVKYGFRQGDDETVEAIRSLLLRNGPIAVRLAKELSLFTGGKDGSVLKVAVESGDLHSLNADLTAGFDCDNKYPEYLPHLTLAFLRPEVAKLYVGAKPPFLGATVTFEDAEWSGADGKRETIRLSFLPMFGMKDHRPKVPVAPAESESYFATCERDDSGHCLPAGQGGAAPKEAPQKRRAVRSDDMVKVKREGTGKDARLVMADGSPVPSYITPAMVPPAWSKVTINPDPDGDILTTGLMKNAKGKWVTKTVYNPKYKANNDAAKFAKVLEGLEKFDAMRAQNQTNRSNPETAGVADCLWLIEEQGTRPGGEDDTKGLAHLYDQPFSAANIVGTSKTNKKGKTTYSVQLKFNVDGKRVMVPVRDQGTAKILLERKESGEGLGDARYWLQSFGATTLEGRHIVPDGDGARLQFVGKEGVWHDHHVRNPELAKMLLERKGNAGDDGKLFGTDYGKFVAYTKTMDGGKFTPKDFRTMRATKTAIALIAEQPDPSDAESYKAAVMAVAEKVSSLLGNRPQQAIDSYIAPEVWSRWRKFSEGEGEEVGSRGAKNITGERIDKLGRRRCYNDGKLIPCPDREGGGPGNKVKRAKKTEYGDSLPVFDPNSAPIRLFGPEDRVFFDGMPDALVDPDDSPAWGPDGLGWGRTMLDGGKLRRVFGEDGLRELLERRWVSESTLTDGTKQYNLTRTAKKARVASIIGVESLAYPERQADVMKIIRLIDKGVLNTEELIGYFGFGGDTLSQWGPTLGDDWLGNIRNTFQEMLYRRYNPVPVWKRIAKNKKLKSKVDALMKAGSQEIELVAERIEVTKSIREIESRLESLFKEASDPNTSAQRSGEIGDIMDGLTPQLSKLHEEHSRIKIEQRKGMIEGVLKVPNSSPVWADKFEETHTEPERESVGASARWLTGKVARGPNGETVPGFTVIKDDRPTTGRPGPSAYYRPSAHAINVHTGMLSVATNIHEMGHGIEYSIPGVQSAAQRFLRYRVGDEPLRKLKEVVGSGYGDWEEGRKDEFGKAFGEASSWYVGKKENGAATEIVSMGVEKLYEDPDGFARRDPEYCAFILGVLDSSIRDREIPQ